VLRASSQLLLSERAPRGVALLQVRAERGRVRAAELLIDAQRGVCRFVYDRVTRSRCTALARELSSQCRAQLGAQRGQLKHNARES